MVEYAVERTKVHVLNFNHLVQSSSSRARSTRSWLNQVERRHNIFPAIDYKVYR